MKVVLKRIILNEQTFSNSRGGAVNKCREVGSGKLRRHNEQSGVRQQVVLTNKTSGNAIGQCHLEGI